jgi:hypothetical protein
MIRLYFRWRDRFLRDFNLVYTVQEPWSEYPYDGNDIPYGPSNIVMNKLLAVTICATRSYTYALLAQARKIVAAIAMAKIEEGIVILVGDESRECRRAKKFYDEILPRGWRCELISGPFEDGLKNYKNPAQLVIARMRSSAFDRARKNGAQFCWSLDSDVLPAENGLRCMLEMLQFDGGFYSVSTCPYNSQGGGDFLGGRGTPERPILCDFYDDEYRLTPELEKQAEALDKKLRAEVTASGRPSDATMKKHQELSQRMRQMPTIGDVFFCNSASGLRPFMRELERLVPTFFPKTSELPKKILAGVSESAKRFNSRGFRRRGWLSSAYPAIGAGAVLPSDWCGFGCTLMSHRALALAQFDGYDGSGTEDLYVVWKRWHRNGLRINVIPHAPCDHVIRDPQNKGKFILIQAFHETRDPECVGHLRVERRDWYQQVDGETWRGQPKPERPKTRR